MHVHSYTCEKFCCTEIILHCVSVSNQLQQWTNFCTNFSPKSGGNGGRLPLLKKVGDAVPPCPQHFSEFYLQDGDRNQLA